MSANTSKLPIGIECLIDERDFSSAMKRYCFSLFNLNFIVIVQWKLEYHR